MDHRISKDMISNGMTPSGQKSQQDLSRSQYGSAATPSSLAEAYRKIHEMDERSPEANAAKQEAAKLKAQKEREAVSAIKRVDTPNTQRPAATTPITAGGGVPSQSGQVDRYRQMARERARKSGGMGMGESADLFDIVKGHLIDEHNLSEDVALQLMSILDEETRADIVEYTASMGAGSRGTTVKMTADGKEPIGDRLLKGIGNKIGGFLNRLNPNALKSNTVEPRKPLVSTPKN